MSGYVLTLAVRVGDFGRDFFTLAVGVTLAGYVLTFVWVWFDFGRGRFDFDSGGDFVRGRFD